MSNMIIFSTLFTILLTVAIIGGVFFFLKKSGMFGGNKALLQNGAPANATVVSIQPTGMIVNDLYYQCQLGLRVSFPGEAPYDVLTKEMIAITSMAMVTPGTNVAVRVDPADRSKVAVDWEAGVTPAGAAPPMNANPSAAEMATAVAAAAQSGGLATASTGTAADLLRSGQRVLGVLTEYADTGNTPRSLGLTPSDPAFIDDPMFALTLQLHIPNMSPMESKVVQRVPRSLSSTLQMGMQLNCAVDPANPTREVAVDWGDIAV